MTPDGLRPFGELIGVIDRNLQCLNPRSVTDEKSEVVCPHHAPEEMRGGVGFQSQRPRKTGADIEEDSDIHRDVAMTCEEADGLRLTVFGTLESVPFQISYKSTLVVSDSEIQINIQFGAAVTCRSAESSRPRVAVISPISASRIDRCEPRK